MEIENLCEMCGDPVPEWEHLCKQCRKRDHGFGRFTSEDLEEGDWKYDRMVEDDIRH